MVRQIVLAGGCFDLLHYGHLQFLIAAKKLGDYLVIALESDTYIIKHKKRQPVHTQNERYKILINLKPVDRVIKLPYLQKNEDYLALVKKIRPKVIAISGGDPKLKNKLAQAKKVGAEVKTAVPLIKKFSTNKILKNINY
jgi:FAD synthetase